MLKEKKQFLSSIFWSMGGQIGAMFISLVTNVLLARILSPFQFGQIGIIMFFILISNVLTESGLGGALVRKLDVEQRDYSTVFIFNFTLSLFLYIILFFISGSIANYYGNPGLENLLQVSGIVILINSFQVIQNAKLVRAMKFKRKSIYYFNAVLTGSMVGLVLAYNGYGVWSLVFLQLTLAFLLTCQLWIFEGAFFSLNFSKSSFLKLFNFGVNTTLASILNTTFDNIYQLILARSFSINQVGLFYQGKKLQEVPNNMIKLSSLNVVYSSLSKHQSNKKIFLKNFQNIVGPLILVCGAIALIFLIFSEGILSILYGKKWMGAEFYMQVLAVGSFFYLLEMFNRLIFKVFDRTRSILHLELLKKGIQIITIFIGLYFEDIKLLIFGFLFTNVLSFCVNYYYSRKLLGVVDWFDLKKIFKVVCIFLLLFVFFNSAFSYSYFRPEERLFFIPLVLIFYALLLKIFDVSNLILDMKRAYYIFKK